MINAGKVFREDREGRVGAPYNPMNPRGMREDGRQPSYRSGQSSETAHRHQGNFDRSRITWGPAGTERLDGGRGLDERISHQRGERGGKRRIESRITEVNRSWGPPQAATVHEAAPLEEGEFHPVSAEPSVWFFVI
jgi:hypothetical protein